MTTNNHFDYFIKAISDLDTSFTYDSNDYESLKKYIEKIHQNDLIQHTVTDLHIQNRQTSQHLVFNQP